MEALKRKPNLSVRDTKVLDDGTKIEVIGVRARVQMELTNNKKMSDYDRGIHLTAAKLLVDGQPVCYDDLLDCFTDDELTDLVKFANGIADDETDEGDDDEKNV